MKYLVYIMGALLAIAMASCTPEGQQEHGDEAVVEDTAAVVEAVEAPVEVTGVAIDGAMNSVYLKVGNDTIEFTYPDLDSEHRASWAINDTLTVRYIQTPSGDSVTDVINHADA